MSAAVSYPQTRLEQLAQQLRLTIVDFQREYAATSRRLADAGQGKALTVSHRQVRRWLAGDLDGLPHLSSRRVLDQMFGEPAERLFGPTAADAWHRGCAGASAERRRVSRRGQHCGSGKGGCDGSGGVRPVCAVRRSE